jgi:hypothetical protein
MIETFAMRHPYLITSAMAVSVVLALTGCGGGSSADPGFTTRGRPPADPAKWTWGLPSSQMADEAEALIAREREYASPECAPAKSLDGTGEFNFRCTAEDPGFGGRRRLDVIVFGSASGEPVLGPIETYRGE